MESFAIVPPDRLSRIARQGDYPIARCRCERRIVGVQREVPRELPNSSAESLCYNGAMNSKKRLSDAVCGLTLGGHPWDRTPNSLIHTAFSHLSRKERISFRN